MKKMIMGMFPKHKDADEALSHLKGDGFAADEVSVIAREDVAKNYDTPDTDTDATGTVTGAVLGGLAGLLAAITPVVIPGVGLIIAGPLAALTGFALGSVTGGLIGALIDIGLSEDTAKSYEAGLNRGSVLVSVVVNEKNEDKARDILKTHNAEELTVIPYSRKAEEKLYNRMHQA